MAYDNAMKAYNTVNRQAAEYATPEELITMLLDGLIKRLGEARLAVANKDIQAKSEKINKALAIINGLRDGLDHNKGGDIADRLESLYVYMQEKLLQASRHLDPERIDHVSGIALEIKQGWTQAVASNRPESSDVNAAQA